jgi:hypothetical protein
MDKLEQYLDRVCRGIAGPRSLRQHVRAELREHLQDAAAEHQAAGMTADEAIARALADFGTPEDMRAEMEATHGHRLMAVVIDKAMQWKEHTMIAKWLWTTWAHVALALVIATQLLFLALTWILIIPKHQTILREIFVHDAPGAEQLQAWMNATLRPLAIFDHYGVWIVVAILIAWALFEWRLRSENKSRIRLSLLATASLALMVEVALLASVMILCYVMFVPAVQHEAPEKRVTAQFQEIDQSLRAFEAAATAPTPDWDKAQQLAGVATNAIGTLSRRGSTFPALLAVREPAKAQELRMQLTTVNQTLSEARDAITRNDAENLRTATRKLRANYDQLMPATTRPAE